jgi:hypothetical protein
VASGDDGTALVLVRDGRPLRVLPAGRYRAWAGGRWSLKPVPLSLQSLDIAPQDLLTADQVPVRPSPRCSSPTGRTRSTSPCSSPCATS